MYWRRDYILAELAMPVMLGVSLTGPCVFMHAQIMRCEGFFTARRIALGGEIIFSLLIGWLEQMPGKDRLLDAAARHLLRVWGDCRCNSRRGALCLSTPSVPTSGSLTGPLPASTSGAMLTEVFRLESKCVVESEIWNPSAYCTNLRCDARVGSLL